MKTDGTLGCGDEVRGGAGIFMELPNSGNSFPGGGGRGGNGGQGVSCICWGFFLRMLCDFPVLMIQIQAFQGKDTCVSGCCSQVITL